MGRRRRKGLVSDLISALQLESEKDLKRRTAMNEEMDNKIWSKLPEELLMLVLSSLPTLISRTLRVVCKRWRDFLSPTPIFRQISSTLVPSSSPAFLLGRSYLLHSQPLGAYQLSLDFMGPEPLDVLTSCKSILCCRSFYIRGRPTSYYICNPLTRTWIKVPPRHWETLCTPNWHFNMLPGFGFYGLAFDSIRRTCLFVIGKNNRIDIYSNNMMEMEIYDSHTTEWTIIKMKLPNPIYPWSQGIYSKGSFYWINQYTCMLTFHLVAFNVAERNWGIINLPSRPGSYDKFPPWDLTGYDGNVLLLYKSDLSLWKLNEEHDSWSDSWSEVQLFPRSLREENARRLTKVQLCPRTFTPADNARRLTKVVANSCGWLLVYLGGYKIVVFDAQGRMVRCIQGNLVKLFDQLEMSVYGYEINNVWWP